MERPGSTVRRRLPQRALQLRLAALYGGLFLLSGFVLLAIPNVLVRAATRSVVVAPGSPASPTRRAIVIQQHGADLHAQLVFSLVALAIMVALSIGLGWLAAGRVLRPLRTITATAREISASNLHRRLDLGGPDDELRELGATLDDLLARLQSSFESQRHFVANASHELRTPITAEHTLLQVALADPDASAASLRTVCEQVLELGCQQEQLIDALLTLATSERGVERWAIIDLSDVVEQVTMASAGAAGPQITIETALSPTRCAGDLEMIQIMVSNLLSNGIRHNVPGGWLRVATSNGVDGAVLEVANSGPVVRSEDMDRLLQPFERQHRARLHRGGHGLGLAIVRAVAEAHHARLDARPRAAGGLDVAVTFVHRPRWPGP